MTIEKGKYIVIEKFKFDSDAVMYITDDFPFEEVIECVERNKFVVREATIEEKALCFRGYDEHGCIGIFLNPEKVEEISKL